MNLYPYQQKIFDEIVRNFQTKLRQLVVVPTGGGKTVIFSHVIKYFKLKTLVIAHTKELLEQCKKTLCKLDVPNVDVFSVQKCFTNLDRLPDYECLIIDECHRAAAHSYSKLINKLKNAKILGVTATPFRHDGKKLSDIFGDKISPLSLLDMINQKLLCDFEGYRVKTNISLKGIRCNRGEFICSRLEPVINVKNRNELIVKEYLKIAPNEKTLCFAVNIKHSDALAHEFRSKGISCVAVHGNISSFQRKKIISDFKENKIQVLINCQILTEGFDEPSITCLLMARPTCSKVLYTQMIGRGSRLFPGKEVCKVIEFTDNEYDVSCIEKLITIDTKRFKINDGETLSKFYNRIEKLMDNDSEYTIVEKINIIHKSIYEKEATSWQKNYLNKMKISYIEPLSEISANQLIKRIANGIN